MRKILTALTIITLCLAGGAAWAAAPGGNTVTINGVFAGHAYGNSTNGGVTANADPWDNTLNIESGADIPDSAFGAQYNGAVEVKNNTANMNGGKVGVGIFGGRNDSSGGAKNNTATISGGTAGYADGGYSEFGDANDNKVTISGGTVTGNVTGGDGGGDGNNNTVTISGGTVKGDVIGGYGENGDANDNTVTISGSPTFGANTILYGGAIGSGTGNVTGNKLELKTAVSVKGVRTFEFIDFHLPADIAAGGNMLTVTDAASLGNVKVDLKFAGATPNLSKSDVITLIDKVTGTFTIKAVTISDYRFVLSVNEGKLIAIVTAAPGGGGGGCNAGLGFLGLLALAIPFVLKKRG